MAIGRINKADPTFVGMETFFTCCGIAAIIIAVVLLAIDKKKGYGLQQANVKK